MPLFSETRSAKAATTATAVCFVLACAALVGITEIVNHGRAVAQDTIATEHPSDAGKPPDQSTTTSAAVLVPSRPASPRRQLMGPNNTFNDGGGNSTSK